MAPSVRRTSSDRSSSPPSAVSSPRAESITTSRRSGGACFASAATMAPDGRMGKKWIRSSAAADAPACTESRRTSSACDSPGAPIQITDPGAGGRHFPGQPIGAVRHSGRRGADGQRRLALSFALPLISVRRPVNARPDATAGQTAADASTLLTGAQGAASASSSG